MTIDISINRDTGVHRAIYVMNSGIFNKRPHSASIVRSSAAEYLTFIAATGAQETSVEMRYENENIWLTQKMMAALYDVTVAGINQHLKRIVSLYLDFGALQAVRKIPMSMADWAKRLDGFLEFNGNEILTGPGRLSHEQAKLHAETEFEKYRIVQDRLFESDFDRLLSAGEPLRLEASNKKDSL
jgi:hypothetical protein